MSIDCLQEPAAVTNPRDHIIAEYVIVVLVEWIIIGEYELL